jgi:hypothetical protein
MQLFKSLGSIVTILCLLPGEKNPWIVGVHTAPITYTIKSEIIATSNSFIIAPPVNPNIYLDRTMYRYGDTMMITCNRTDGLACANGYRVRIIDATTNSSIYVYYATYNGFDLNPLSLLISWGWGTFQAILMMGNDENEQEMDISDPFQVMVPNATLAINKMTYELGDKMIFIAIRTDGGIFTDYDFVAILPENSTSSYFDRINSYRGNANSSFWKRRITTDWTPGRYKVGLVLGYLNEPIAETSVFEVKKKVSNPITVWTDKNVYNYGDRMSIGRNRTDYSDTYGYYETYLRKERRMRGRIRVNYGYGKFQVVLFNRFLKIRAISEDFEVLPPTGISVTTDKNLYTYGDSMTITFKSENKYKFRDSDTYSIVTSGTNTDTYGISFPTPLNDTIITTSVDFLAGGDLRIDLLNDDNQPLATTSNPFQIVRPTNVIVNTDKTIYQVGNTITVSVTGADTYDGLESLFFSIVPENVTTIQEIDATEIQMDVDYQSPNTNIPIDWTPGKYKAVLLHYGSATIYIVSVSQVFDVQP